MPYDYSGRSNQNKDIFRNSLKSKSCPTEIEGFLFYIMERQEVWKTVPGFEDYQISNLGRVKSLKFGRELILKGSLTSEGYLSVSICKNRVQKTKYIHQLVAEVFLNHKSCKMTFVVDHKNLKKTDNSVDNLQIVTFRENTSQNHLKSSSKYTGVSWSKNTNKWRANIYINGKLKHLGLFKNEIDASNAYQKELSILSLQ